MTATISDEIGLDESVTDFLRREGAQEVFREICEIARSCFPVLKGLEVNLQEDPDEVARTCVIVCVRLPDSYSDEQLQAGMRSYHEKVIAQVPLDQCLLFALVTEFSSE